MRFSTFVILSLILLELLLEASFGGAGGVGRVLIGTQRNGLGDIPDRYTIGETLKVHSPDVICRKIDAAPLSSRALSAPDL